MIQYACGSTNDCQRTTISSGRSTLLTGLDAPPLCASPQAFGCSQPRHRGRHKTQSCADPKRPRARPTPPYTEGPLTPPTNCRREVLAVEVRLNQPRKRSGRASGRSVQSGASLRISLLWQVGILVASFVPGRFVYHEPSGRHPVRGSALTNCHRECRFCRSMLELQGSACGRNATCHPDSAPWARCWPETARPL